MKSLEMSSITPVLSFKKIKNKNNVTQTTQTEYDYYNINNFTIMLKHKILANIWHLQQDRVH